MSNPGTKTHNNGSTYQGFTIIDTKNGSTYRLNYIRTDGSKWGRPCYHLDMDKRILIGPEDALYGMKKALCLNMDMVNDIFSKNIRKVVVHLVDRKYIKKDSTIAGGTDRGTIKINTADIMKCPVINHSSYIGEKQYEILVYTDPNVFWFDETKKLWVCRAPILGPEQNNIISGDKKEKDPILSSDEQLLLWWEEHTKDW